MINQVKVKTKKKTQTTKVWYGTTILILIFN